MEYIKKREVKSMGNRAVITTKEKELGIYCHWNGGPNSVCAFLTYAKAYGVRDPEYDPAYFFARLSQIISNFFGGTLSIGVNVYNHLDADNGDNGVYIVSKGFDIVERLYNVPDYVETVTATDLRGFLYEINHRMGNNGLSDEDLHLLDEVKFVKVPGLKIKGE